MDKDRLIALLARAERACGEAIDQLRKANTSRVRLLSGPVKTAKNNIDAVVREV